MTEQRHIILVWDMAYDGSERMSEYRCDCPAEQNHDEADTDYQLWWKEHSTGKVWCPDCAAEREATAANIGDIWYCTVCGGHDF